MKAGYSLVAVRAVVRLLAPSGVKLDSYVILAVDLSQSPPHYATWQSADPEGRETHYGHYFEADAAAAVADYNKRGME